MRAMTTRLRQSLPAMIHPPKHAKNGENTYSPRELRWLLAKQSKDLSSEEQEVLSRLLASSQEVRLVHALVQRFLRIRSVPWRMEDRSSSSYELPCIR